jgi:hypothetical protein
MTPFIAIALLFASGSAASAPATESAATTAAVETKKPKPKKICKTDPRVTGTRIAKRVCKTEEEWNAKEDGQDLTIKGHAGNPAPVCMMCKENP